MDNEAKIQYLANIYHLVRSDGRVGTREEDVMEAVAQGIGVGYLETRKALDLSMEKDFVTVNPKRWSDRIRNVEDMLLVAYADGKLSSVEKQVLVGFANKLGISQKQFGIIKEETKDRFREMRKK
ncbi:MAG: hypothetical protein GY869_19095 [Planctomycetes bacterium]|nr:hypothetical protein [Planctomycetota bacterium]